MNTEEADDNPQGFSARPWLPRIFPREMVFHVFFAVKEEKDRGISPLSKSLHSGNLHDDHPGEEIAGVADCGLGVLRLGSGMILLEYLVCISSM